jgi:uncharacterized damage-inducible protein DinB
MISTDYVALMAAYSGWQNQSIYGAADRLSHEARLAERGAFFGSIFATLNHLLWGDQLWLHRLAGTEPPVKSDIPGSVSSTPDWPALKADRFATDAVMLEWSERVTDRDLRGTFSWHSGAINAEVHRPRWALVVQLFNHGTHHRGQVHAMLTAAGGKPDATDVPFMPDEHFFWPGAEVIESP